MNSSTNSNDNIGVLSNNLEKVMSADDITATSLINKRVAATIATNNILNNSSGRRGPKKGKLNRVSSDTIQPLLIVKRKYTKNKIVDNNKKKLKINDSTELLKNEKSDEENDINNENEEKMKEVENKIVRGKRGRKRANTTTTELAVSQVKNKYNKTKKQDKLKNSRLLLSSAAEQSNNNNNNNIEQDLIRCKNFINELARHENGWPFLEPVDQKSYPDYYEVIKNPIDIKTIKQKVKNKE